ncbi:MAG TPA: TIGR00730 family Rossman fold protein, partial [Flavisolibacter sp.]|nr:TIGR00730 family Rossman fold protein [Flavisolibacter sp.]
YELQATVIFEDIKKCFPFAGNKIIMSSINKMAIFCGSKIGNNKLYVQHANELATLLAEYKIELIFGGGKNGLMGVVADGVMKNGGTVTGVIPEVLLAWESQHQNISELLVVEDMHVRKRTLYNLCDAAIILPGGFGTLDELFEILTWNQLSIHDKKIFIMNSGGFYDHLLMHLKILTDEGFLYGALEEKFTVLALPSEILNHLNKKDG